MYEEFIWLSGMIKPEKMKGEYPARLSRQEALSSTHERVCLSKLEALSLIHNGFLSLFAPEQARKSIISPADQEVLSILAEEYLDIGKD